MPKSDDSKDQDKVVEQKTDDRSHSSNTKLFNCPNCKKDLYLTSVETLKHRKICQKPE